jgi:thiol-disulfide isomerase/thioredoxin
METIVPLSESVRAPELDGAIAWLNVERPLSLRELRGCVVVLDFWTYCCINCMHVLPTLREIEQRHRGDPLVVIGVHSGKFSAERDPSRIREAIGRYEVEHPVAVDDDMRIWSSYGIRSWPTLVVVRPDGRIAAIAPGEPDLETLDGFLADELAAARKKGTLAPVAPLISASMPVEREPLCYPGKAIVLPDGRLAVSDSGHHRVLVCARDGEVVLAAGSGLRGWQDGAAGEAAFDDPQGMCWHAGRLYVADTRNHCIRSVDLGDGRVTTVAGTGRLGGAPPPGLVQATTIGLRSPWDLAAVGEAIYVAMAGSHQIWRFFPDRGAIEVYAGSGNEALIDGDARRSAWAQPSGLAEHDGVLYVADSETSAVRAIDLARSEVRTLVGQGLFDFGDEEGDAGAALLQHCLGVAAGPSGVLIADTYNGKIKRLTVDKRGGPGEITTLTGDLSEPGSVVAAADGTLLIADTNAHRIVRRHIDGRLEAIAVRGGPRALRGALEGAPSVASLSRGSRGWFTLQLQLPEGAGLAPGDADILLTLRAPAGAELAPGPLTVSLEVSRRSDLLALPEARLALESPGGPEQTVRLRASVDELPEPRVEAEVVALIEYVACVAGDQAACFPGKLHLRLPVRLLEDGAASLDFAVVMPELPAL